MTAVCFTTKSRINEVTNLFSKFRYSERGTSEILVKKSIMTIFCVYLNVLILELAVSECFES
jgi:hypothetical protein